jgi:hypothetical protein
MGTRVAAARRVEFRLIVAQVHRPIRNRDKSRTCMPVLRKATNKRLSIEFPTAYIQLVEMRRAVVEQTTVV